MLMVLGGTADIAGSELRGGSPLSTTRGVKILASKF
jgi:hypothetical protein